MAERTEIPSTARSVSSKNLPNPNMVKRSIKKDWNLKIKQAKVLCVWNANKSRNEKLIKNSADENFLLVNTVFFFFSWRTQWTLLGLEASGHLQCMYNSAGKVLTVESIKIRCVRSTGIKETKFSTSSTSTLKSLTVLFNIEFNILFLIQQSSQESSGD